MKIGVPKEDREAIVAATPDTVGKLIKLGYDVVVESGAGAKAAYPDELYVAAGAQIGSVDDVWHSDIVTSLNAPAPETIRSMRPGAVLLSRLAPGRNPELIDICSQAGITALSMDAIPRISRAQSMDVLSSMANIAGYRAVIEAAHTFGRLFTGQVTAAGKVPPAHVYVIGAGVAGLAAIGTANSMGAVVHATDVRPEVAEQVESMGAQFVPIPTAQQESSDGYAKEMSADQEKVAQALYAEQAAASDIVITTAQIPGRPAPRLLTREAVAGMKPGSIIVDMAAASGGNCELTQPGQVITTDNGVTIIGHTDLAGRLPAQASQLFGQNIVNFMKLTTPAKDGTLTLDETDVIVRSVMVTREGAIMWPPPPVQVSAAPTAAKPAGENAIEAAERAGREAAVAAAKKRNRTIGLAVAAVLLGALVLVTPQWIVGSYIVLALAVVVGFYVITNVTHSLHTPLMSVTNAISGIILVGAILQIGSSNWLVTILSFLAIVVASINIFGGFTVTRRMLAMFRKDA